MLSKIARYFIFAYIVIFLIKRRDPGGFDYKQAGIQSAMIALGITIVDWVGNTLFVGGVESFRAFAGDVSYDCVEQPDKTLVCSNENTDKDATETPELDREFDALEENDFNQLFDEYATSPMPALPMLEVDDQDKQGTETSNTPNKKPKDGISGSIYNSHYGYTYMDPKTWRVGGQTQPPVCLTDSPCIVNPILTNTSLGAEFLAYSYLTSKKQKKDSPKQRCKPSTVYNT